MKQNVYSTELVTSLEDLASLKDKWDELLEHCINPSFYHDFRWYMALSSHLTSNIQYITVYFGESLVAILPVDLEAKSVVQVPHCCQTDLTDIVLHKDHCSNVMANAVLREISKLKPNWHRLEIFNTPANGAFKALIAQCHLKRAYDPDRTNYFFETESSENLKKISKKLRKNIARQERLLQKDFGASTTETINIDRFLAMDKLSWKGQTTHTDILSDHSIESFYRELAQKFAKEGRLHINAIKAANQYISVQFGIRTNKQLSLLKIAYLPEFHKYGPGNQHLLSTITDLATHSEVSEVNLTTGPTWAKRWHPKQNTIYNVQVFNDTLIGRTLFIIESLKAALRPLKQKLYGMLRRA